MLKFKSFIVGGIFALILTLLALRLYYVATTPFYNDIASQNSIDKPEGDSVNLLAVTNTITLYNINDEIISKLVIPKNTSVYHNGEYMSIMSTGGIDDIIDHIKMLTGVKVNYYIQTDNETLSKLKTQIILKNENIYSNLSITNMLKLKNIPTTNIKTYTVSGKKQKNGLFLVENTNLNTLRKLCFKHFKIN